jgi:hypothetical protein
VSVREPAGYPVRPPQRQRRLADPGAALDDADRDAARLVAVAGRHRIEVIEFVDTTDEPEGFGGKLPRYHRAVSGRSTGCGLDEALPIHAGETEGVRQQTHRRGPRRVDPAGLDLAEAAHAQTGRLGEVLLGHPLLAPVRPHDFPEHHDLPVATPWFDRYRS